MVTGIEVDEQLVHLVEHFFWACIAAVDLVDDDDGRQIERQCLLQHVAGLRQWALGRIDEQQHAVDHGEGAFDFATEVGVAGGVNEVDLGALPCDGSGLGENGDATLSLLVVAVHHAVNDRLMGCKGACCAQQGIDECGFTVVDVRDKGDIS
ncbi:unannotated protein [freshwater metagenome]|uniref:Unannotated protein n=1 Tax=freshwater metagenome TaxID=449393 RepID=A0A6J6XMG5_9ZZZZ